MKNKFSKILSILLTLILVFSACTCVLNTVYAAEKTYYVSSGGSDSNDASSQRKAVQTVAKAIEIANAAGYGAGDTVTLKVLNTTGVSWSSSASPIYLPTHDFKLIITSQNNDGSAIVGTGDKNVNFGGDIDFKNIKVNFGSGYHNICSNGHNITFDQSCVYNGNAAMSYYMLGSWSNTNVINDSFTLDTSMAIGKIGLGNFYSKCTFNGDVNVNYRALSGAPTFWFGADDNTTYYNAGINLTVNAASVGFTKRNGNVAFGDNSYVQVLNNTASSLKASDNGLSSVPSDKLWVINNILRASDLVTLTETKGKFAVNTEVYSEVKAISVDDPSVVIKATGGYLTLPAGAYNVTASKIPQQKIYYVKDGENGDGTEANPVGSVAAAITKAITDGYIVNDEITVKVMGSTVEMGTMPAYPFNLIVDSNDPSVKTKINCTGTILANGMGALTTYKNVEIYKSGQWGSFHLRNSDVVFESSCKLTTSFLEMAFGSARGDDLPKSNVPAQKVVMNCEAPYGIFLGDWIYSDRVNTEPTTFILNNSASTTKISFNAYHSSVGGVNGTTTFKNAVNIGIFSAKSIEFKNIEKVTFEEAVQIINGSSTVIKPDDSVLSQIPSDKRYILNNDSGDANLLDFTDTVGKFKVNLSNPEHKVVFENVVTGAKTYYDNSGYMTVAPGVYTVNIERDPVFAHYYVDPSGIEVVAGTRPATAGTKENPVKTFADATRLIAQDGLAKVDVATVHLKDGIRNYWKNEDEGDATYNVNPSNFVCTVVIDSYMEDSVSELYTYNAFTFTGNIVLRNVNFTVGYQWADCSLAGYSLTIEETASLSCPYIFVWKTEYGKVHKDNQSIIVDGVLTTSYIALAAPYHNHTSTGDFNFYFNNPDSPAVFRLGPARESSDVNTYQGNININVKQAKTLSLSVTDAGANIEGALQILADDSVLFPYSVKTNFESLDVAGGKWYITNAASDDDFVSFSSKGKLNVKDGKTAYSRQYNADQVTHTGGEIDFSLAPGAYTVSDKAIDPLPDESHKMLYFFTGASSRFLGSRAKVTGGETYQFEYTIYNSVYEDCKPIIRDDSDRGITCDVEIVSEKKIGDCYKIVARGTIPDDYNQKFSTAFFGVQLNSYSEGIIFDRTVYNVNDRTKKDCYEGNQFFHDGLDYVTLDYVFWGKIFTDERGGTGLVKWEKGIEILEVMTYNLDKITEIKHLSNPNDGKWWNDKDIKAESDAIKGKGSIKGTFKYRDGRVIPGKKMLLVGEEKSYTSVTNSNGKFKFIDIPAGNYYLYLVDGSSKIDTGFSAYLSDGDLIEFDVINDVIDSAYEEEIEEEEYVASGNLQGTVYTPQLETVANLKILLKSGDKVIGEVITDEKGTFGFANIPVGTYELYAINEDGSEYLFREVDIQDGASRTVKLKYDPSLNANGSNFNTTLIIIIIAVSVIALLGVGVIVFFLFRKKKVSETV